MNPSSLLTMSSDLLARHPQHTVDTPCAARAERGTAMAVVLGVIALAIGFALF